MTEEQQSPSPFLPGTSVQLAVDSTSLGYLKRCPRSYEYAIIDGWRSKGSNIHLIFGGIYHSALEAYEKLRLGFESTVHSHDEALCAVVLKTLTDSWIDGAPWISDDPNKNRETLVRSVIWYLDQFENDNAKTIVLKNGKPAVELSFRMELDWGPSGTDAKYLLCGHLDKLVEFGGQTFVLDHKTTKSTISPYYFAQYEPDNQMSLYSLAAVSLFDTPAKGVMISAVQVAVGFSRFERGITYRSIDQHQEWLTDLAYWLRQGEKYAADNYWPQNDTACFNCQFRKICSKAPSIRETYLESDFIRQPWNPLKIR